MPLFKLEMDKSVPLNTEAYKTCIEHSYMWNFYQKLYVDTKKRFRVDMSLIDYNLQRLHECLTTVATQRKLHQKFLTWDEMLSALEFYLQIDGKLN